MLQSATYAKITAMKRNWLILVVVALVLVLIVLVVKSKFFSKEGPGALQIASTPQAAVYVDGEPVGSTPFFNDKIVVGEHTIKLVPEEGQESLQPWEGKVDVTASILTLVKRDLAAGESSASGEIVSLEKIDQRDSTSLSIVSDPDKAVVKVNGEPHGFAPVLLEELSPGDFEITVSLPGYQERTVSAHALAGYKVVVSVKLAQKIEGIETIQPEEASEEGESEKETEKVSATPTPKATPLPKTTPGVSVTPPPKPYIKIKETPTGWLRVRSQPNTNADAEEVAKVYPGEMYPYLEEKENDWYKIEYKENQEGWVSSVYVELVE